MGPYQKEGPKRKSAEDCVSQLNIGLFTTQKVGFLIRFR